MDVIQIRNSQPTYAYKIYQWTQGKHAPIISLTTYICIQDISLFSTEFAGPFTLTTYICIQDISPCYGKSCIRTRSQPTYAYKIYRRIDWVSVQSYSSQPTYAYKIYHCCWWLRLCWIRSQPTYAYKIYLSVKSGIAYDRLLTTYICIQDISDNLVSFADRSTLTTYICIQDISVMKIKF